MGVPVVCHLAGSRPPEWRLMDGAPPVQVHQLESRYENEEGNRPARTPEPNDGKEDEGDFLGHGAKIKRNSLGRPFQTPLLGRTVPHIVTHLRAPVDIGSSCIHILYYSATGMWATANCTRARASQSWTIVLVVFLYLDLGLVAVESRPQSSWIGAVAAGSIVKQIGGGGDRFVGESFVRRDGEGHRKQDIGCWDVQFMTWDGGYSQHHLEPPADVKLDISYTRIRDTFARPWKWTSRRMGSVLFMAASVAYILHPAPRRNGAPPNSSPLAPPPAITRAQRSPRLCNSLYFGIGLLEPERT
ncbi:hypothetical protein K438DRAFT_2087122, partial [Mycena galopus ATCC 62051]